MIPIVKNVFPPVNTEALWVDLSGVIPLFKIYRNGEWQLINNVEGEIESLEEAIEAAEKALKDLDDAVDELSIPTKTSDLTNDGEGGETPDPFAKVSEIPTALSDLDNDGNFVTDADYTHTDNNYTSEEKTKLGAIEAEANKTTVDSTIAENGANPVTGGAIFTALGQRDTNLANHISDGTKHLPATGTREGKVLSLDANLNPVWVDINYLDTFSYGVEWDDSIDSPNCTRVGNPLYHINLPIQSGLKGCVAQGGRVMYYLNPNNWAYKEDGVTASVLDGTDGTVRVDTGTKFYGKSFVNGTKSQVRISTIKIDDSWVEIPRLLVDAYRATVMQDPTAATEAYLATLNANSAVSIVNTSENCRGGGNRSAYDVYLEGDVSEEIAANIFRTDLGKPRTNISRANMRTYAQNAGAEMLCYEWYKWIFYWLPVIEFATFNMQQSFVAEPTAAGFKQGGLGAGLTNLDGTKWNNFNGYYPITPCGYANSLGNFSGSVAFTLTYADGTTVNTQIARYRGIENIFGDAWTNLDGIILQNDQTEKDGSNNCLYKNVWATTDAEHFGDSVTDYYKLIGREANIEAYIGSFALGDKAEIIPASGGGDATKKKCDYHWIGSKTDTNLRTLLVGGSAHYGARAGLGFFSSRNGVGYADSAFGFRTLNKYVG